MSNGYTTEFRTKAGWVASVGMFLRCTESRNKGRVSEIVAIDHGVVFMRLVETGESRIVSCKLIHDRYRPHDRVPGEVGR